MKNSAGRNQPVGRRNARINGTVSDPLPITFKSFILHRDIPGKRQFEPLLMSALYHLAA